MALLGALALSVILAWPLGGAKTSTSTGTAPAPRGLFIGVNLASLPEPQRQAFSEAEVDFARVLKGLPPLCKSEPDSGYSDGGTVIYQCKHYQLMVVYQIFRLDGGDGYLYGPQVTFRDSNQTVSDVRYYTGKELSLLLKAPSHAE